MILLAARLDPPITPRCLCAPIWNDRSRTFVYVPDSAVSEPATARGGKHAAPNRFLKPYVWIGAVIWSYVKELYTKDHCLGTSLCRPAGKRMTPEDGLIQVCKSWSL